jgi:hypothetical protein
VLERVEYLLEFWWNERESAWYFRLADSAGDDLRLCKLTLDWPLLRGLVDDRRPPGELIATDTLGTGAPAGLQDLGQRVIVRYIEAATVLQLITAGAG